MTTAVPAPTAPDPIRHRITTVELQEYLYASTLAEKTMRETCLPASQAVALAERLRDEIRTILRIHRFTVFTWLSVNDVRIPVALNADEIHPAVGSQAPDEPVAQLRTPAAS